MPVWNCACVRNAPIFWREGSLGCDPDAADSDLMMGMKMPPARADVEGMAGASRVSATLSPTARPSVDLPMALTNMLAMRSPSPVFSKPLAKKKDTTMSQMTSLVMALNACAKVSVFVARVTVTAMKAHAPTGRGSSTRPRMVVTKIDSSVHPCVVMPSGMGIRKRIARPTARAWRAGMIFTPIGPAGASAGAGLGEGEAAAAPFPFPLVLGCCTSATGSTSATLISPDPAARAMCLNRPRHGSERSKGLVTGSLALLLATHPTRCPTGPLTKELCI
mmetsp:Transcript_26049/g.66254  ORF Transcript_26049/g.66254 Transcript_26049/m.66254 type:complete len:277 (+) Transcript_26049:2006-2836(+)